MSSHNEIISSGLEPPFAKQGFPFYLLKAKSAWFCYLVVLPWLLFAFYTCCIKTPVYESNARFLLGDRIHVLAGNTGRLGAMFHRGKQVILNTESTFVLLIQKYVYSEAMLATLQDTDQIKDYYQSKDIDCLSRLKKNPNQQEFLDYFLKKVHVVSDPMTGELLVSVKAFSPGKAQQFLGAIEKNTMQYVNKIMHDSVVEQSQMVEDHMVQARDKVMQSQLVLTGLIDKNKKNGLQNPDELQTKRLELKFAQTEYDAAQRAYVLWKIATRHPMPITTSPASLPDYFVSPQLPNDLVSVLLILMIIYFLEYMIALVVREHVD